jgi:hypothetical protein
MLKLHGRKEEIGDALAVFAIRFLSFLGKPKQTKRKNFFIGPQKIHAFFLIGCKTITTTFPTSSRFSMGFQKLTRCSSVRLCVWHLHGVGACWKEKKQNKKRKGRRRKKKKTLPAFL